MIFDADLSQIDAGVWREYQGSKFLIAHISNMKFQRALSRLQQPYRKKLADGSLDPKTNQGVVAEAMAEGVLIDWQDVKKRNGELVPYGKEAATELLKRDPEFRDWVSDVAMNMTNFRDEEVKALGEA